MKIAILRLSALGDVIVSGAFLAALKSLGAEVHWFIDTRFDGVLRDSPCVDSLHSLPFKQWLKSPLGICKIYRYMRSCGEFDMVVDMQGLLKSALLGKLLKTKKFIGFGAAGCRERFASVFYTHHANIAYDANVLVRNFVVLFSYFNDELESAITPILRDSKSIENLESAIENLAFFKESLVQKSNSFGVDSSRLSKEIKALFSAESATNIAKAPQTSTQNALKFLFVLEASIEAKTYPIERYEILAAQLQKLYGEICVYIIWHSNEARASQLANALQKRGIKAILLPRCDLNAVKFILVQMHCVIGGDTGIVHLAWALGDFSQESRQESKPLCITLLGNSAKSHGKNMSQTRLKRVLLGNPVVVSGDEHFCISEIEPREICRCIEQNLRGRCV